MFARFSFDIPARRILGNWQEGGRKCQQPEVIVMRSMAARWAWPAIARSAEIVDSLLQCLPATVPACALRERGAVGRNVVNRPMMPNPRRCVGVITENDKTAGFCWRIAPSKRRGPVFALAGKAPRNRFPVGKGTRSEPHGCLPHTIALITFFIATTMETVSGSGYPPSRIQAWQSAP